jgi:hypothetical protein
MTTADRPKRLDLGHLSKSFNHPALTISAVVIALALGASQHPLVQYLRPIGDFYLALLQMCVLPFLLATIPLAVRSAMVSGTVGASVRGLLICLAGTVVVVALISVLVPSLIFRLAPIDERTITTIGALIGSSADRVDIELALDLSRTAPSAEGGSAGMMALVPTNIFASLSGNDSLQVLVFAAIFGIGMVATERRSGYSIFGALRHIQALTGGMSRRAAIQRTLLPVLLGWFADEGLGLVNIAKRLNERGTRAPRGGPWNTATVRLLVLRGIYAGIQTWGTRRNTMKGGTRGRQQARPEAEWIQAQCPELALVPAELFAADAC